MRKGLLILLILSQTGSQIVAQNSTLPSIDFQGMVLQAHPHDHFIPAPWGQINLITGAGSENDGKPNTHAIVNKHGNWSQGNYAANICAQLNAHGFDDWYLPSMNELLMLHQNRQQIGGFQTATYWSSNENPTGVTAKQVAFPGGYVMEQPKSTMARVRCVRKQQSTDGTTQQSVTTSGLSTHDDIELALLEFHNEFLPGFDYQKNIKYPPTQDLLWARTNMVIAIGQDIALILTVGKTELVVKKMEFGVKAADYSTAGIKMLRSINGKPLEAALEIATVEMVDKGLQKITKMPVSMPGLRSGVAVYALFQAETNEQDRINEAINQQMELLQLANDVAPAIEQIVNLINLSSSPDKTMEYLTVLDILFKKKAELTVYRQMKFENHRSTIMGIEGLILQEIDYNLAVNVAQGSQTPVAQRQVLPLAINYALGFESKENLDRAIRHFIRQNKPFFETDAYVNRVFNAMQRKMYSLEKAREEINKYGGSLMHGNQRLRSYQDLLKSMGMNLYDWKPARATPKPLTREQGVFTDPRDGQTYRYVQIGDQVWMAENLRYLPSVSGPVAGSTTTPYHYVYGYNGTSVQVAKATQNYRNYGVLYNWPACMNACPPGWKLPSDAEWTQIRSYVRDNSREVSRNGWQVGSNGSNDLSFLFLPGGSREMNGFFDHLRMRGFFWTSSGNYHSFGGIGFFTFWSNRSSGFSLRCVRDLD